MTDLWLAGEALQKALSGDPSEWHRLPQLLEKRAALLAELSNSPREHFNDRRRRLLLEQDQELLKICRRTLYALRRGHKQWACGGEAGPSPQFIDQRS